MQQEIQLNYINASLQIGLVNWKEAYLLYPVAEKLLVAEYKGSIVYRKKGSPKRIYYKRVKQGLTKSSAVIYISVPGWIK